jgi:putative serine protease PepD
MLEVISGPDEGKTIEIPPSGVTIGRDKSAGVKLADDEISREHVQLKTNDDGTVQITDLDSRNGTVVDGKTISRPTNAGDGAQITIGRSRLKLTTTARKAGGISSIGGRRPSAGVIAAVIGGIAAVVVLLIVLLSGGSDNGNKSSAPLTTAQVVSKLKPSTVQVLGKVAGRTGQSGTGWILDPSKGLIVTNAHVIEGSESNINSILNFGKPVTNFQVTVNGFPRGADIYAVAPCEDLAILRTPAVSALPAVQLGSQSDIQAGDKAISLGYPGNAASTGNDLQANEGTVSVPKTRADASILSDNQALYPNVVQTDTPINPGNSGGPLVDDTGKLIGVTTLGSSGGESQNQNYAIGVDQVKQVTDQMKNGDSIGWAGIGFIALGDNPPSGFPPGLLVTAVFPGTGSDQGGLQPFDVITALNGRPVTTRDDYCNAIANISSGESASVDVALPNGQLGTGRIIFQ